jgi:hypothetical protein
MATATATKSKKSEDKEVSRVTHKTEAEKVKSGDVMAIVHFVKVDSIDFGHNNMQVTALDEGAGAFGVHGRTLIENAYSADTYKEEVEVSKTKAAELLVYIKQGSESKGDKGDERILRGRLIEPDVLMGRSKVEDLDEPLGKRFRLVCHRTLRYIIVDGTKYNVKGA